MTDYLWEKQSRRVFALLRKAKISIKADRIVLYQWFFHDETIGSTNDLSTEMLRSFGDTLAYWDREGRLETEARTHIVEG